jgi:hypothetical protein
MCSFFLISLFCLCWAAVVILVPLLLNPLLRPLLFLPSLVVAIHMGFDGCGLGKLLPFQFVANRLGKAIHEFLAWDTAADVL